MSYVLHFMRARSIYCLRALRVFRRCVLLRKARRCNKRGFGVPTRKGADGSFGVGGLLFMFTCALLYGYDVRGLGRCFCVMRAKVCKMSHVCVCHDTR